MNKTQIVLAKLHPAQIKVKKEARRFNVVACGRRFGKTELGKSLLMLGLRRNNPMAWFAPTYRMMLEVWREMVLMLAPIARVYIKEQRIEVINGTVIEFWSLDSPDVARGRKYGRVIVDEAAMIPRLSAVFNDVLRPLLADFIGDAFFLSSPRGRNDFYKLFQRGLGGGDWQSWQFPTSANPYIEKSEIESMRLGMPDRSFRQEILAEFVEDGGGVFRGVRGCAIAEPTVADKTRQYVAGLDWALSHDYTVLTIVDIAARAVVHVDRFNGIEYSLQRMRIGEALKRYNAVCIAEANAMGKPNNDMLRAAGCRVRDFTTTNTTKSDAIESLASAFEQGNIKIPNDAVVIGELESYESERLGSGAVKYGAPAGMHDDTVMSLALAWHGITEVARSDLSKYGW